jgi:transposase
LGGEQQSQLKAEVTQNRYSRVMDVARWVKDHWHIQYSEEGMREMLHNLGFSYQKGQIVPGKADSEEQVLFFEGEF